MPVRTTVVGSWWLHPEMEKDLARHHAGECSPQESEAILNRAASKAIKEQRDLGLDEWTGGEYHTDNFIENMHKRLTGLEVDKPQADDLFDYDDMTHAKVVGKITAPNGLGYLEAFRREKKLPGGVNKAAVVAPYEVIVAGRDQLDALHDQVPAITKIVNAELRAMADEGCPNVQLDAPIFGGEVNMGMMTAQQAADLIAPCFEGVKAKKSLHFCNGNLRGPADFARFALRAMGGHSGAPRRRRRYRGVRGQIFLPVDRTRQLQEDAEEHAACRRHCRRRQLLDRDAEENPRTHCRLGARGRRRTALGLAVVRLWPPPFPQQCGAACESGKYGRGSADALANIGRGVGPRASLQPRRRFQPRPENQDWTAP